MKYLHLINDEKFTDFTVSLFEEVNQGNNVFIVGVNNIDALPVYTKTADNVYFCAIGSIEFFSAIKKNYHDVLVVHYMDYFKAKAILKQDQKKIIVWLSWGADIYNTKFYNGGLFQLETSKLLNGIQTKHFKTLRNTLRDLYYLLNFKLPPTYAYKRAVAMVDYCGTVIPSEIDILKKWPFFKAKQVPFSYACVEDDFKRVDIANNLIDGNGILVGNSTSPTSNHLDVFLKLKDISTSQNRSIVVPLNYGTDIIYRDAIVRVGENLFEEDFKPLFGFLNKAEYIKLLRTCNIAILDHDRQQGVGNVILLLWLGCKLFISENSSVFVYFKSKGFVIYSFQKELDEVSICHSLNRDQVQTNRRLLLDEYGKSGVLRKVKSLITTVSMTSV